MKRIITTIIGIVILAQCFAQSYSNGTYNTNYGRVKFVTEIGTEYPTGGIIYGDYKDNGTITGTFQNNAKEVEGSFHNGASEGKFVFFPKNGVTFFDQINGFYGNWGYQTNNKYSTNPDHKWEGTKTSSATPNDFTINVWSGKWNTSQGYLILQQVGNKVTGKYHTVGDITATYNPSTRKLTGTFTNNGKQGYLEYIFEGNSFKGKWGWTTALTGGDWTGTKHVKTNKATGTTTTTNSTTATTTTVTQGLSSNTTSETVRYRVSAHSIHWWALGDEQSDLYGFAGVRVYRVTNGSRTEIANFGRKDQYFFNTTEEHVYPTQNYHYYFPKTASFQRDFVINLSDFKNPAVDIEIELWHHLRRKRVGENMDNGKIRMVYNVEELPVDKNGLVSFGQPNKMFFKIEKL